LAIAAFLMPQDPAASEFLGLAAETVQARAPKGDRLHFGSEKLWIALSTHETCLDIDPEATREISEGDNELLGVENQ
jgi:hypothetical protein